MPWVRLDDQFPDNPKIDQVGPLAAWLYVCGLCYSARMLTDGYIPDNRVRKLTDIDDIPPLVTALLTVGLWVKCDGGYRIHDYHEYNPSAEQVKAQRQANKERQARFRNKTRKDEESDEPQTSPNGICNDGNNAVTKHVTNTPPVPTPVPNVKEVIQTPTESSQLSVAKPPTDTPYALFVEFLDEVGTPEHEVAPSFKKQQISIAKQLIDDGFNADKVRRCYRYIKAEEWRTGLIDLRTVKSVIGAWELDGMPEKPKPRASPRNKPADLSEVERWERNHSDSHANVIDAHFTERRTQHG